MPSSVLSTEDIVESKTQTPFLYLWSMVRVGWRVSLYSISCKINQDNQTVHDALEGEERRERVGRGRCGWGREDGSPVHSEAGGRGHPRCLLCPGL